jgi:hypothetical protein
METYFCEANQEKAYTSRFIYYRECLKFFFIFSKRKCIRKSGISSAIFLLKKEALEHIVTQNLLREGVSVIPMPGKDFRNAVPVCVLLRKKFRNGILSQKYPWIYPTI